MEAKPVGSIFFHGFCSSVTVSYELFPPGVTSGHDVLSQASETNQDRCCGEGALSKPLNEGTLVHLSVGTDPASLLLLTGSAPHRMSILGLGLRAFKGGFQVKGGSMLQQGPLLLLAFVYSVWSNLLRRPMHWGVQLALGWPPLNVGALDWGHVLVHLYSKKRSPRYNEGRQVHKLVS